MQFANTLEANILAALKAVAHVTINKVTPGSISVDNTVAFNGADTTAAKAAQSSLVTLLSSPNGVGSVYGSTFGNVTVTKVQPANSTNPSEYLLPVLKLISSTVQAALRLIPYIYCVWVCLQSICHYQGACLLAGQCTLFCMFACSSTTSIPKQMDANTSCL